MIEDELAGVWDTPGPRPTAILRLPGTPDSVLFAWAWGLATVVLVSGAAYLTHRMQHPSQRPTLFVASVMMPVAVLAIAIARHRAASWRRLLLDGISLVGRVSERHERPVWSQTAPRLASVEVGFTAPDGRAATCRVVVPLGSLPELGRQARVMFHADSKLGAVWLPGIRPALGRVR